MDQSRQRVERPWSLVDCNVGLTIRLLEALPAPACRCGRGWQLRKKTPRDTSQRYETECTAAHALLYKQYRALSANASLRQVMHTIGG